MDNKFPCFFEDWDNLQKGDKFVMQKQHWLMIVVLLLVGYLIGVKFPATGQSLLSKVGM